jgi:hypothetical protein
MKKIFLLFCFIIPVLFPSIAQNKKAEKDSIARVQYEKALAAIEAKEFVIIVETYEDSIGSIESSADEGVFLSLEKDFVILQGQIVAGNKYTNKLKISEYNQVTDKKGNVRIIMQVIGFYITAKIEISMKKGGNYADVIIIPTKGTMKRFTGEIIPTAESKYFKRTGEI